MKTQFKPNQLSLKSIYNRLIKHCENQPFDKWLLVRHIFDVSYSGYFPSRKLFNNMLSIIQDWARQNGLTIENKTVGDWDFIRFVENPKTPQP